MFRGRYEHTIDAKGRTSVPARYRDVLAPSGERRIVLTSALDPCLVAYTTPEWTRVRGAAREAAAVRPRGAEAEAHLRVGRRRVRDRRRRAASSSRRRCATTRGLKKDVALGRRRAGTPSSGTRTSGTKHFETTDDERRDIGCAPRGARAMSNLQLALPGCCSPTRDRVGLARRLRRGDRREALRARDRDARRGRPRARAARRRRLRRRDARRRRATPWRCSRPSRRRASSRFDRDPAAIEAAARAPRARRPIA